MQSKLLNKKCIVFYRDSERFSIGIMLEESDDRYYFHDTKEDQRFEILKMNIEKICEYGNGDGL